MFRVGWGCSFSLRIVNFSVWFSVGWLGWSGFWFSLAGSFFQLVVFLVGLLFQVGWLGSWGCSFSLKIVNFSVGFSVGWLGWLDCWFSLVVGFFQLVVFLVGLLFRVGWGCSFSLKSVNFSVVFSVGWLGWLGWLGCWFCELVVFFQLVVFLVGLLFQVC